MGKKMRGLMTHYSITMYDMEYFCGVVEARENKRMIICMSAYTIVWGIITMDFITDLPVSYLLMKKV